MQRSLLWQSPRHHIAQRRGHMLRGLRHDQGCGIHLFEGMLVLILMHHNQRFSQRRRIARIKSGVPLLVFFTEPHNDHIGLFNTGAGANGVELRALAVMPKLICLRSQNFNATIIAGRVICHRPIKGEVEIAAGRNDLRAPIGVNFAGKVNTHENLQVLG